MLRITPRCWLPVVLVAAQVTPLVACADTATTFPYGQVWSLTKDKFVSGESDGFDPRDMEIDAAGNIVVAGGYCTSDCNADSLVARVSPSGSILMKTRISGISVSRLALDASGNIYLAGALTTGPSTTFSKALKLDPAGNQLWSYVGSKSGSNDRLAGITVLGGNAYVVGRESDADILAELNGSTGVPITTTGDQGTAITTDGSLVYVAAYNGLRGFDAGLNPVYSRSPTASTGNCMYNQVNRIRVVSGVPYVAQGYFANGASGNCYLGYVSGPDLVNSGFKRAAGSNQYVLDFAFLPTGQMAVIWGTEGSGSGLSAATRGTDTSCCPSTNAPTYLGDWDQTNLSRMFPHVVAVGPNGYVYVAGEIGGNIPSGEMYSLEALASPASRLPKKGAVEIRNNVIRVGTSAATIIVNGTPGAHVGVSIFSMGGVGLGKTKNDITIGGEGAGMLLFDGTLEGGISLPAGMYWVVTSGDIADRKQIVIIDKAKKN